jgi:hypothetical protein
MVSNGLGVWIRSARIAIKLLGVEVGVEKWL